MIEGIDYFVRLVDFPVGCGINGLLMLNPDGTYSVYLNSRASEEAKKKAMKHEFDHMIHDDMYAQGDISEVEEWL